MVPFASWRRLTCHGYGFQSGAYKKFSQQSSERFCRWPTYGESGFDVLLSRLPARKYFHSINRSLDCFMLCAKVFTLRFVYSVPFVARVSCIDNCSFCQRERDELEKLSFRTLQKYFKFACFHAMTTKPRDSLIICHEESYCAKNKNRLN